MNSETLIYDHIAIVLALYAQDKTLLSNLFTNQYFFLNNNSGILTEHAFLTKISFTEKNDIKMNIMFNTATALVKSFQVL